MCSCWQSYFVFCLVWNRRCMHQLESWNFTFSWSETYSRSLDLKRIHVPVLFCRSLSCSTFGVNRVTVSLGLRLHLHSGTHQSLEWTSTYWYPWSLNSPALTGIAWPLGALALLVSLGPEGHLHPRVTLVSECTWTYRYPWVSAWKLLATLFLFFWILKLCIPLCWAVI
jgi:hypothetical protein